VGKNLVLKYGFKELDRFEGKPARLARFLSMLMNFPEKLFADCLKLGGKRNRAVGLVGVFKSK